MRWLQANPNLSQFPRSFATMIEELAADFDESLPASAEKSAGMRKLLEAKDCFVRAAIEESERRNNGSDQED